MTNEIGYILWIKAIKAIPTWELMMGIVLFGSFIVCAVIYVFVRIYRVRIFHAFEKIKLRSKDVDRSLKDTQYVEITIPKNSQVTAFQVQQKILKALHATYADPIEGAHAFSRMRYFFQKLFRLWQVYRSEQVFFTMQIWAQYPSISFRFNIPTRYFDRIEKAIFNAYPNAEVIIIDKDNVARDIMPFHKSYLSYGQSTIEGKFYHRIKTFKDVSSDPVDSIISIMEGLAKGQFMAYNITLAPTSHFFNQVIHYLLEEQEHREAIPHDTMPTTERRVYASELATSLTTTMLEKMKSSLFQIIISYWAICPTPEEAEAKIEHFQAVLNELNQKNMNMLKHQRLFTKHVEAMAHSGQLQTIIAMRPVVRLTTSRYWPFSSYENYGQVVADSELYSFWHLPNITNETVSSVKMTKFKKLPASHAMREFSGNFFINLGASNFRMQEDTTIGVPTWDDMKKHIYILGGTGAGKSETLKRILDNLLQKEGEEQTACLIVDPKNDFATVS